MFKSRFVINTVAARATESDPAETTVPGTTLPFTSTEAQCDELYVSYMCGQRWRFACSYLLFMSTLMFESARRKRWGSWRSGGSGSSARFNDYRKSLGFVHPGQGLLLENDIRNQLLVVHCDTDSAITFRHHTKRGSPFGNRELDQPRRQV